MDKRLIALQLTLAVLKEEDYRVLGNGSNRSACGEAVAKLFNTIYATLDLHDSEA